MMFFKYILFITTGLFTIFLHPAVAKCPNGCICQDNDHELKCRLPAARTIPQNIFPKNVTSLNFSDNNMLNIQPGCLRSTTKLEELILDGNKVYYLENGAFKGGKQLRKVSLEDNNIHFIENDVFSVLPDLEELNLSKNQLTTFPNFDSNHNLLILSLSYNNIDMIAKNALRENHMLRELNLESNKISSLSRDVFPEDVSNYTVLNLVKNNLRDTPSVVREMINLETLNLCHNPIKIFRSDDFRPLSSLKTLTLTDVGLSVFSGNVFWFPTLEYLDISKNKITGSSLSSIRFENLKTLKLSGNPIDAIGGNSFRGIRKVEKLFASSCGITGIDDEAFSSLTKLKKLDLQNNKLSTLPKFLKNTNLEEINVNNNQIFAFAPNTFSSLNRLEKLLLANNSLSEISSTAFGSLLTSVNTINLSGNKLTRIPTILPTKLINLVSLDISKNSLINVFRVSSISRMKKLGTLNLKENQLEEIVSDVSYVLPNLKNLYMCDNNLTEIGNSTLGKFPNLKEFTADRNKITKLNKKIFENNLLLKKISMNRNGLEIIEDDTFTSLTELSDLMLLYNKLKSLPKLTNNPKLTRFGFCNNQLGDLPVDALKGPEALEIVLLRSIGMTSLNSSMFENIRAIKYLNLAFENKIKNVPPLIRNMTSLRVLKLTGNPIEHLTSRDFEGLNNLRELYLDDMKIKSMDVTELFTVLPALRTLYLAGNPWICDCEIQWYALGIDGNRARVITKDREDLKCAGPGRLYGKSFDYLRMGDFGQCVRTKVVEVDETSAVVSLPPIQRPGGQRDNVVHRVSYVPLVGEHEESVITVQKPHREVRLSTLIPDTPYVVCTSTFVTIRHTLMQKSGPRSKAQVGGYSQTPMDNESCSRFRTKEPKIKTPWSNLGKAGLDENPKYLIIVIGGLAGALAIVLVATLASVTVWCKRVKAKSPKTINHFDDPSEEIRTVDNGLTSGQKSQSNKKIRNGKTKQRSTENSSKDKNGEVVEMNTNSGNDNRAFDVNIEAQRTKL